MLKCRINKFDPSFVNNFGYVMSARIDVGLLLSPDLFVSFIPISK